MQRPRSFSHELTPPELMALSFVSYGLTRPQVASALSKSPHTIKRQLEMAQAKLAAKNQTHAVAVAIRQGLI